MTEMRRYTVEIEEVRRQRVTFISDDPEASEVTRVAAAMCKDDRWEHVSYARRGLESERVRVEVLGEEPDREEPLSPTIINDLQGV